MALQLDEPAAGQLRSHVGMRMGYIDLADLDDVSRSRVLHFLAFDLEADMRLAPGSQQHSWDDTVHRFRELSKRARHVLEPLD